MAIKIWSVGEKAQAADINTNFEETIEGRASYAVATGSANAFVVDLPFDLGSLVAGQEFTFKANFTITGPCTVNPDTLGALSVRKNGTQYLEAGDIVNGQMVRVKYDGTNLQMLSTPSTLIRGFDFGYEESGSGINAFAGSEVPCGFCGGSVNRMAFAAFANGSGDGVMTGIFDIATDIGIQPYIVGTNLYQNSTNSTRGVVHDGSAYWHVDHNFNIKKNGTNVTIASGGSVAGPMGIDTVNSYLLMLTTTTNIRRWTGIAGTTVTQHSNITLDTAVTQNIGFLYDTVNQQYVCVDTTNNLLRRFNSSGVTIDTTAYTINDAKVVGVQLIGRRVYLAVQNSAGTDASTIRTASASVTLVPTTLVI